MAEGGQSQPIIGMDDALTIDHLIEVYSRLDCARTKWFNIGLNLSVGYETLSSIKSENQDNSVCLREMLAHRLKSGTHPLTYRKICKCLRQNVVNRSTLAQELEEEMVQDKAIYSPNEDTIVTSESKDVPLPDNLKKLAEDLEGQLQFMDLQFNALTSSILRSLVSQKIPKQKLVAHLKGINCLKKVYKGRNQCLFCMQKSKLDNASTLYDVWEIIEPYFSFFDFEIISQIVKSLGTDDDKKAVVEYKGKFKCYILNRKVSPMTIRSDIREDGVEMFVKLDSAYDGCEGATLVRFRMWLSTLLNLADGSVLQLCKISVGCVELTFDIPVFIANTILPLSVYQEAGLKELKVIQLNCEDYSFPLKTKETETYHESDLVICKDTETSPTAVLPAEHSTILIEHGSPTPQLLAIRKNHMILVRSISIKPEIISDTLFANGYLSQAEYDFACNDTISNPQKASKLVDTMLNLVEQNSTNFHKLLLVLTKSHFSSDIIELLQKSYDIESLIIKVEPSLKSKESVLGSLFDTNKSEFIKHWLAESGSDTTSTVAGDSGVGESDTSSIVSSAFGTRTVDSGVGGSTFSTVHGEAFVCPYCKKCTMEQFFSEGCPKQEQISTAKERKPLFPYLDVSNMNEEDRMDFEARLIDETREIKLLFAKFTLNVIRSLEMFQTPLEMIKISVLNLSAFTDDIRVKVFDDEDSHAIQIAENLSKMFIILQKYTSFFDYHIIKHIIDLHGTLDDHARLQEYIEQLKGFCQRNVFAVPHDVFPHSRRTAQVLALKCTEGVFTMNNIVEIKRLVARTLCLQPSALQLYSIKKGCVELYFLISAAVADRIFPVSPSQHSALSEMGVKVFQCNVRENIEYRMPQKLLGSSNTSLVQATHETSFLSLMSRELFLTKTAVIKILRHKCPFNKTLLMFSCWL